MEIEVSKRKGIDTLVSGYSPGKVEEEKELELEGDSRCGILLRKFEEMVRVGRRSKSERYQYYSVAISGIYSASEIDSFVQVSKFFKEEPNYGSAFGRFMSKLIHSSHDNNYVLNFKGLPAINFFLDYKFNRPLSLEVMGNLGEECCCFLDDLNLTVHGDVGRSSCRGLESSRITIHGKAGGFFGQNSSDSYFFVEDVGHVHCGIGSKRCIFASTRMSSVENMIGTVSAELWERSFRKQSPTGNKIIFIHPDGEEEEIADYSVQGGSIR